MMRLANWLATSQKTTIEIGPWASTEMHASSTMLLGVSTAADRRFAIEVATTSPCPTLIVPSDIAALPRRAVLGLDFSRLSLRAAKAALDLLERPAAAHLVSVGSQREAGTFQPHLQLLFDALEDFLGHPADVAMTRHHLAGDVASAILTFAKSSGADLIAIGSPSRSRTSIGQTIIASASCSVFLLPSPP